MTCNFIPSSSDGITASQNHQVRQKKEANKPLTRFSQPLPSRKTAKTPSVNTPPPRRVDNHESNMSHQINQTPELIHPENQQNDTPTLEEQQEEPQECNSHIEQQEDVNHTDEREPPDESCSRNDGEGSPRGPNPNNNNNPNPNPNCTFHTASCLLSTCKHAYQCIFWLPLL